MKCNYCGAEVPENEDFCPECGGIIDREEDKKDVRGSSAKGTRQVNTGLLAALIIVAVILVAGISVVALDMCGVIKLPKISLASNNSDEQGGPQTGKTPLFEADPDDPDHFFVTVFAKAGTVLIYENTDGMRKEVEVPRGGSVKFKVPASALIPQEPIEGESCEVVPIVYTKNTDGSETRVEGFTPLSVSVPALIITFENSDSLKAENGSAVLSGSVIPADAAVTVEGVEVAVGQDGSFSHTLTFSEAGEHTVSLEARLNGYQVFRRSFTVTVDAPSAGLIQFPWEYGDDTFSQRVKNNADEPLEVWGRVPIGSRVTASCTSERVELTEPTVSEDGTFSFMVSMPSAGDYELHITCFAPSGEMLERAMHVQRAPEWRSYVESSWAMSYEALRYASKQAYKIVGTVTEVIEDEDCLVVLLDIGEGNSIILRYYCHYPNAGSLAVGSSHTGIYGYPMGRNEDGVPVVYVWFVID